MYHSKSIKSQTDLQFFQMIKIVRQGVTEFVKFLMGKTIIL